jgi:hypothetical protein
MYFIDRRKYEQCVSAQSMPAFERTSYLWSNIGCAVDRK